jgi:hypothetical protein
MLRHYDELAHGRYVECYYAKCHNVCQPYRSFHMGFMCSNDWANAAGPIRAFHGGILKKGMNGGTNRKIAKNLQNQ